MKNILVLLVALFITGVIPTALIILTLNFKILLVPEIIFVIKYLYTNLIEGE